jgi:putative Holliday junction resolvase
VIDATRAMGVDLGSVRIGLALSDPTRTVASPHDVLARAKDHATDHEAIVSVARREGVSTVVVGLPLSLSGGKGPAAKAALAEVEELRAAAAPAGITVVVHDERLTTVTAERALNEARVKRADRKLVVDKIAAAVMLQAWLDAGARTAS